MALAALVGLGLPIQMGLLGKTQCLATLPPLVVGMVLAVFKLPEALAALAVGAHIQAELLWLVRVSLVKEIMEPLALAVVVLVAAEAALDQLDLVLVGILCRGNK